MAKSKINRQKTAWREKAKPSKGRRNGKGFDGYPKK